MTQAAVEHARDTAEAVARRGYGKLVAFLAARTGDVAGAEDALSDAFAAALADWPASGIPRSPEAWLLAVARRKMIDAARRRQAIWRDHLRLMAESRKPRPRGNTKFGPACT
jgi:RNA polymerase sigma-70 factor (ECF subfamily)